MATTDPDPAPELELEPLDGSRWRVVRARSRTEKQIVKFCAANGVAPVYLPLRRIVRRYEKHVRVSHVPLIPGYVFARCGPDERETLSRNCSGVCGFIDTDDSSEASLLRDLRSLYALERAQSHGTLNVSPEIETGKRVAIEHGPFRGFSGIVTRRRGKARIVVNVELIGRSASLEVNVDEVTLQLDD